MSWQYVPGLMSLPHVPNWTPPHGVWRGKGSDSGFFAFSGDGNWGRYIIVRVTDPCPHLLVDGSRFLPVLSDVNGYIHWSGGGRFIYYSLALKCWVMCDRFPGYEPVETSEYDRDKGEYVYGGDSFHIIDSIPYNDSVECRMTARGAIRGQSPKTLKAGWDRWTCDTECGVYEAKDGASGKRVFGLPQFKGNGETFLRSLNKTAGYFTYGRIRRSGYKWVIGEPGSEAGWHEGSEPKADGGPVTFAFKRNEGSEATGSDITVSFDRYVLGNETDTGWLGEVAVWR